MLIFAPRRTTKAGYNSPAEVFLAEYENGSIKVIPYAN